MSKVKIPEPITADEIRFGMRRIDADQRYIEVEQAEAYAQARVDEALEEVAEIADRHNDFSTLDAIRALKEQS